jgi:hypothetical protein
MMKAARSNARRFVIEPFGRCPLPCQAQGVKVELETLNGSKRA